MKMKTFLTIVCLLCSLPTFLQASPLKVATSEWVPYVGADLPNHGLAIEIVKTALQRAGYETEMEIKGWSHTLEGVDIGVYDLIAAAWYSEKRAKHFTFSKPYLFNEIKLVKRVGSGFQYRSPADLQGKVVGVMANYAYGEAFDKAPGVLKVPGSHVGLNILRVLNREIDLTLDDERVLRYFIRHHARQNANELQILPNPLSRNGLHIAVSKQNPRHKEIAQAFDKAIVAMKKDGTLDRIIRAHAIN